MIKMEIDTQLQGLKTYDELWDYCSDYDEDFAIEIRENAKKWIQHWKEKITEKGNIDKIMAFKIFFDIESEEIR